MTVLSFFIVSCRLTGVVTTALATAMVSDGAMVWAMATAGTKSFD